MSNYKIINLIQNTRYLNWDCSIEEAAERCNMEPDVYKMIEEGKRRINIRDVINLSAGLTLSAEEVIDEAVKAGLYDDQYDADIFKDGFGTKSLEELVDLLLTRKYIETAKGNFIKSRTFVMMLYVFCMCADHDEVYKTDIIYYLNSAIDSNEELAVAMMPTEAQKKCHDSDTIKVMVSYLVENELIQKPIVRKDESFKGIDVAVTLDAVMYWKYKHSLIRAHDLAIAVRALVEEKELQEIFEAASEIRAEAVVD